MALMPALGPTTLFEVIGCKSLQHMVLYAFCWKNCIFARVLEAKKILLHIFFVFATLNWFCSTDVWNVVWSNIVSSAS